MPRNPNMEANAFLLRPASARAGRSARRPGHRAGSSSKHTHPIRSSRGAAESSRSGVPEDAFAAPLLAPNRVGRHVRISRRRVEARPIQLRRDPPHP